MAAEHDPENEQVRPDRARTYWLAEVAAIYLPPEWDGVLWLSRRLRRGEIPGYKVGRVWRMTEADVDAFVAARRAPSSTPKPVADPPPATPAASIFDGLSARSSRRYVRRG